jgi:mRNA-degrading endonuclease toxin of MazEF toxin-antitoxin module
MTRSRAIPVLSAVLVAPVTRRARGIPSEVAVGPVDGMPVECAATFDNLRVVPTGNLTRRICTLAPERLAEAGRALRNAVDC